MYPQRIVCLTEESTKLLYLLGEEHRIVGISGFTVRPARARQEKPRVSAFTSATGGWPGFCSTSPEGTPACRSRSRRRSMQA